MHRKTNSRRRVRRFVLVISWLHIIVATVAINFSASLLFAKCKHGGYGSGFWGSLANLLCASFGLTLSVETKRKLVLIYVILSACTVVIAAFQLATESAGLAIERQFCAKHDSPNDQDTCELYCINIHTYIMAIAVSSLFISLFSGLVLAHALRDLSAD